MERNKKEKESPDQLNPGQKDQFGNEVVIKKNEGISEQGNEWTDKEEMVKSQGLFGEKAEKYLKEGADVEDLPDEDEEEASEKVVDDDDGEDSDDVIEDKDDFVKGFDLGRNKVQ